MKPTWHEITLADIPDGVRFDVPRENQGQIIEIAYGGFDRAPHTSSAPFKRVNDTSRISVRYYRRSAP